MKIRTGFVSNSSSSSFVVVGFNINDDSFNIDKAFEALDIDFEKEYESYLQKKKEDADNPDKSWVTQEDFEKIKTVIGKEKVKKEALVEIITEEFNFDVLQGSEDGVGDDDIIFCKFIADIQDDYTEQTITPLSKIEDKFKSLKEIKEKIAPELELNIYSGIRMC